MAPPRIMLLAERLAANRRLRGQAFNFSNELQLNVLDLVEMILRLMESALQPEVRNEASNEIRASVPERAGPGASCNGGRCLRSNRACGPRLSPGTRSSSLMT